VKLLRVLQERQVRPVGSTRSYEVDVRLLAATNRSLEDEVKQGRFRPDLFYRLNVVRIALPPLRDRREDVLPLASRFVRHLNERYDRHVRGFAPDAARALQAYDFPGNVRELEHLLERAYALGLRDEVTLGDLPSSLLRASPPSPAEAGPSGPVLGPLEQAEREAIVRALAQNGNDKSRAAETLGISRRTLYRRLKELHLGAEDPPP
jgi:two-component system response regulator PilR (NtrC family)